MKRHNSALDAYTARARVATPRAAPAKLPFKRRTSNLCLANSRVSSSTSRSAYPATYVSWNDAMDFCRKLMDQERRAGRLSAGWEITLPTEAQ